MTKEMKKKAKVMRIQVTRRSKATRTMNLGAKAKMILTLITMMLTMIVKVVATMTTTTMMMMMVVAILTTMMTTMTIRTKTNRMKTSRRKWARRKSPARSVIKEAKNYGMLGRERAAPRTLKSMIAIRRTDRE